jgi:hypothetical protein
VEKIASTLEQEIVLRNWGGTPRDSWLPNTPISLRKSILSRQNEPVRLPLAAKSRFIVIGNMGTESNVRKSLFSERLNRAARG